MYKHCNKILTASSFTRLKGHIESCSVMKALTECKSTGQSPVTIQIPAPVASTSSVADSSVEYGNTGFSIKF